MCFEKAANAQNCGKQKANYSNGGPIVPNEWPLEWDRILAFEYLSVRARHQNVEIERQTE
jgi:hypothetical protein